MSSSTPSAPQALVLDSAERAAPLGDLLIDVFDEASRYSTDPDVVARIAIEVVLRLLRGDHLPGRDC